MFKKILFCFIGVVFLANVSFAANFNPTQEEKITGLYIGFYKRAADYAGLKSWLNAANSLQKQSSDPLLIMKQISFSFSSHPYFQKAYGSLNNNEFVKAIYQNMQNREGDKKGIDFWTKSLDNKEKTRSNFIADFIYITLTREVTIANFPELSKKELELAQIAQKSLLNKVEVAVFFTSLLKEKTNPVNTNLDKDNAYNASKKIVADVSDDYNSVQKAKQIIQKTQNETDPMLAILGKNSNPTESLCTINDTKNCFLMANSKYKQNDFNKAFEYYKISCDYENNKKACNNLAYMYQNGQGNSQNMYQAFSYFSKACDYFNGSQNACRALGYSHHEALGTSKNLKFAATIYQNTCDKNDFESCHNLALMNLKGEEMPQNLTKAKTLFQKACDANVNLACDGVKFTENLLSL